MEFVWDTGKRFRQSTSSNRFFTDTLSRNSSPYESNPVQKSAGRPVAEGEEQIGSTMPMPSFVRKPSTINSFSPPEVPPNSMADQQRLQISELHRQNFHTFNIFMLEDKIQDPSKCLFQFSLGGNVMDQRSGDGPLSG